MILIVLLACQKDAVELPTETATIDTAIVPPNARPLCAESVPDPVIAPDLVAWADAFVPSANRYYGEAEWSALEALGEDGLGSTPEQRVRNRITRGWSRLKFGKLDEAIADLEAAEAEAVENDLQWRARARELLGATWMRKAETENCLATGGASACIVPFDEHAIHHDPTGMTNAGVAFEAALEDLPDHTSLQWLLNVTSMARGGWPQDVPERWRLPENLLDSEAPVDGWRNHAPDLGMDRLALAGGSSLEDFDGDGLLDVMVSSQAPRDGMDLYLNMGDGHFCKASRQSGVAAIPALLDFKVADYDNDGDLDVVGPRGSWHTTWGRVRPSLLRNDGEGRFTDVAVEAGLDDPALNGPTQVAAWGDVDNDGWIDLFLGREDEEASPTGRQSSSLYLNQRDGTFVDVAPAAGVVSGGYVKGAVFFDHDNDGDQDLYVSQVKGPNRLYENRGDLTFVDRAQELGVGLPIKSFPVATLDVDQDGWLDLVVPAFTNNYAGGGPLEPNYFQSAEAFVDDKLGNPLNPLFSETAKAYRNLGGTGFEDVSVAMGLDDVHSTMGFGVGDFDLDGYPDLMMATGAPEYDAQEPNVAYLNLGGTRFADVTTDLRVGHLQKGHGVSFGDLDEDGDEDLLVDLGGAFIGDVAPPALFVNPTNTAVDTNRHSVTLRLEGVTSNRHALGARVRVVTPERTFHHVVGRVSSFGGNSLQVEAPIADGTSITRVEIEWPGGTTEVVEDVPVDAVVRIRQGEGVVGSEPFARFGVFEAEDPHGEAP